jgi:hypothetical protein
MKPMGADGFAAAVQSRRHPARRIEGRVDAFNRGHLQGWVWFPDAPEHARELHVFANNILVASVIADKYRDDLKRADKRGGHCGFDIPLDLSGVSDNLPLRLDVFVEGCVGGLQKGALKIAAADSKVRFGAAGRIMLLETEQSSQEDAAAIRRLQARGIKGRLNEVGPKWIRGWVSRTSGSAVPVGLYLELDGRDAGSALAKAGPPSGEPKDDGRHHFQLKIPKDFRDGRRHCVQLKLAETLELLTPDPICLRSDGESAVIEPWTEQFELPPSAPLEPATAEAAPAARPVPEPEIAVPARPPEPPKPYLDTQQELELLASQEWEHLLGAAGADLDQFAQSLRSERLSLAGDANTGSATLFLLAATARQADARARALDLWSLQSAPRTDAVLVSKKKFGSSPERLREQIAAAEWCLFARAGDAMHPSCAYLLQTHGQGIDVVLWSLMAPDPHDPEQAIVYRRPSFDPHTLRHNPMPDTSMAVRSEVLADCPIEVLQALAAGRIHPLTFWLTTRQQLRWRTWPEALTVRSRTGDDKAFASREALAEDLELYRTLTERPNGAFHLRETRGDLVTPFTLIPRRRAEVSSIILPVEAGGDGRALRALFELAHQRVVSKVEVVLVAAGDAEPAGQSVAGSAQRMFGHDKVRLVTLPGLSRAAQLNAAASAASGEALLFCTPSIRAELDETVLEEISGWSLVDGVGLVGCGLVDLADPAKVAFGLKGASEGSELFGPLFEPDLDDAYAQTIRACAGHPLALAGIARDKFLAIGGFDERRFPQAGYDVDFILRCARSGLVQLYLGHLRASVEAEIDIRPTHDPISAAHLRQLYPEAAQHWTSALRREAVRPAAGPASALLTPDDLKLLADAAAQKTELSDELRNSLLVQVGAVAEASASLQIALERLYAVAAGL